MLEKIGRNIGKIFLVILGIVLFIGGYQCSNGRSTSKTDSKTSIDTLIVHKVDTIKPKPEIKWYALKPIIRIDTVFKSVYLDSTECNRIYVYEDSINTKEYTLYRKSHIQGRLRYDTTGVKLKVPLVVTNSTTITINKDSLIYKPNKYEIHAGVLANTKSIAPVLELSINKNTYGIGYDLFNRIPYVTFKYRIYGWTPKK